MTAEVFFDSNILIYATSAAIADRDKQKIASDLILNSHFALSSQVLQEFIANALRKPALGITESNIDATLLLAAEVPVQSLNLELIVRAVTLRRRYQLSHWDSTIVAAAQELGCRTLYSEDLSHQQTFGELEIVNPFSGLTN